MFFSDIFCLRNHSYQLYFPILGKQYMKVVVNLGKEASCM
jgi:hypothetical protein